MNLSDLQPPKGRTQSKKRIGRGPGSGTGKTAGRGHKGQKSRSGYSRKRGFEGGQMPLHRRLPKRGFHNVFRVEYTIVNLDDLSKRFEAITDVTPDLLRTHGLIGRSDRLIKVLARGEISVALTIHAHRFSRKASEKIVAAGGKAVELNRGQPKVVEDSGEEK